MDVEKQVAHWRDGALEASSAAAVLLEHEHARTALFQSHLAAEKALKAMVVHHTEEFAPKIHNLHRLAELASLELLESHVSLCDHLMVAHLKGRYADTEDAPPALDKVRQLAANTEEFVTWLTKKL